MSEQDKRVESYLGNTIPDRPDADYDSYTLIELFLYASRGRQVISGMSGTEPRPITVCNITDVLVAHESPLTRQTLDPLMFELDQIYLEHLDEKRPRRK